MIDRLDQNGNYEVKTNKKGQYIHAGLPLGSYEVRLLIDGEERDRVQNVRVSPARQAVVDFDLVAPQEQATSNAPASENQLEGMSDAEREEYEAALKARQAQMAENEALNSDFNTGM
jgi:hypothetical protein